MVLADSPVYPFVASDDVDADVLDFERLLIAPDKLADNHSIRFPAIAAGSGLLEVNIED